ncbi:MAG: site-specific integrase [Clostridiales bacterium]|nr:site-specific integrase [Clostridiales bacterium]
MHITKRNKTYRVTVSCGRDKNNKQILHTATYVPPKGLTAKQEQKAVLEFAENFERKIKGGADVRYNKITFRNFCYDLYYKNHLETLKPKTASGYKIVIESRLIPYFGDMQIRSITPLDILNWISSLERNDGQNKALSQNSIGSWFRTLSAILGKAYSWSIIDENPCKRVKAPSKKADVNALQMEDIYKIMKRLPEYTDIRAKMFVLLALNTGVREAEAAGLEWRDIDLDNHILHIRRTSQYIPGQGMIESTPKSSSSVRDIPISDALITELMNYHHWQSEQIDKLGDIYEGNLGDKARLFTTFEGRPVYDSTLRKWLTKFLEWCDVPRVTVHGLRHTFASVLIANGTDPRTAADLMGHTSPALVMNTYANPQNEAKKRAIQNLNNIYQNKQAE